MLSADLINVRDDSTFDIDSIFEITEYSRCPEISKCQNEKIFNSFINTGSEVIAISEKFNNDNLDIFKSCPTLPSCGKFYYGSNNKPTYLKSQAMIPTKINNLTLNLTYMGVPKLIEDCIIGIDSQEKLKKLFNTEAKIIKITVNDISDWISYNMMKAIESNQYSSLNIIECLDGENDQKSSHLKADFEIQDNVNNKFDVSIEEIEQKTLNIMKCLGGENDQKSSHLSLNIIECIDCENDEKSLHSQADVEFQNYVDNELDVSIEEIEPKINTSYILFIEQKQILKRSMIKYKPVSCHGLSSTVIRALTHPLHDKD